MSNSKNARLKTREPNRYTVEEKQRDLVASGFYDRKCPACGKMAASKYYDERKRKFIYKHQIRMSASVYHEGGV